MPWEPRTLSPEEEAIEGLIRLDEACREHAITACGPDFAVAKKAADRAERRLCLALLRYGQTFVGSKFIYAVGRSSFELHRVPRFSRRYARG